MQQDAFSIKSEGTLGSKRSGCGPDRQPAQPAKLVTCAARRLQHSEWVRVGRHLGTGWPCWPQPIGRSAPLCRPPARTQANQPGRPESPSRSPEFSSRVLRPPRRTRPWWSQEQGRAFFSTLFLYVRSGFLPITNVQAYELFCLSFVCPFRLPVRRVGPEAQKHLSSRELDNGYPHCTCPYRCTIQFNVSRQRWYNPHAGTISSPSITPSFRPGRNSKPGEVSAKPKWLDQFKKTRS